MSAETFPEGDEPLPPAWQAELAECFVIMASKVYRFLLRFTQGDHELAETLVQETFKEAAQKRTWGELRERDDAGREAWLIVVARCRATSAFRHADTVRQKRPQVSVRDEPAVTTVHDDAMMNVAVEHFIKVLNEMPPQQARVAFLYWRCEYNVGEIAIILGITPGRVSQLKAKAEAKLKKELRSYVPFFVSDPAGGAIE